MVLLPPPPTHPSPHYPNYPVFCKHSLAFIIFHNSIWPSNEMFYLVVYFLSYRIFIWFFLYLFLCWNVLFVRSMSIFALRSLSIVFEYFPANYSDCSFTGSSSIDHLSSCLWLICSGFFVFLVISSCFCVSLMSNGFVCPFEPCLCRWSRGPFSLSWAAWGLLTHEYFRG